MISRNSPAKKPPVWLDRSGGKLCARISYDRRGEIQFLREPERNRFGRWIQLSLLSISALGSEAVSYSQTPRPATCGLVVRVADPIGGVLPRARVTVIKELPTPATKEGLTGVDGLYRAQFLPGRYTLRVEASGFDTYEEHKVQLGCNNPLPAEINVQLRLGLMGDVIEIKTQSLLQRFWFKTKSRLQDTVRPS